MKGGDNMDKIKINPSEFAAAYIQTLDNAKPISEFSNRSAYNEYLKKRRRTFYYEYIEAIKFAEGLYDS